MGCLLRVSTEKNAQCESCELNIIGGQNEDSRWEIAFQITLGNCSKAVGGNVSISDFGEMGVCVVKHIFFFFLFAECFC